jgi:biotin carboxyl carrier protein
MKKLKVTVNGVTYEVEVEIIADDDDPGAYGYAATNIYSQPPPVSPTSPPPATPVSSPAGVSAAAGPARPSAKVLASPLPGVILNIKVKAGDSVKQNDPLIILEAMKMETVVSSPVDGTIKEVMVSPSQSVMQGETLVTFE